jgi:hypothetical protein
MTLASTSTLPSELQLRQDEMLSRAACLDGAPSNPPLACSGYPQCIDTVLGSTGAPANPLSVPPCAVPAHQPASTRQALWSPDLQQAVQPTAAASAQAVDAALTTKPKLQSTRPTNTETRPIRHWSGMQRRRLPHNIVERRYRDNLNGQIDALRACIPVFAVPAQGISDVEDEPALKLPSKAAVIASAHDYIQELEKEKARLAAETTALREQVSGLQKLVRCEDCSVIAYFNSLNLGTGGVQAC